MSIYTNTNGYYVYQYLRKDGTPYYIGKGKDGRAWTSKRRTLAKTPTDDSRIVIIKENLSEEEAFALETKLILEYGRIDLGTGPLLNLTNGGEGFSGQVFSDEHRRKMSESAKGRKHTPETKKRLSEYAKNHRSPEHLAKISAGNKGKTYTPEQIKRMSDAKIGIPKDKITCPYCGKSGGIPAMNRWHMENCKYKK